MRGGGVLSMQEFVQATHPIGPASISYHNLATFEHYYAELRSASASVAYGGAQRRRHVGVRRRA